MTKVTIDRALIEQVLDAAFSPYCAQDLAILAPALRAALAKPAVEPRPVTPYTCPKCHALWLHWPSEQTGIDTDTLNCRSAKWCDYCEKGGVEQLKRLERVPASLKAPVREPSPPPPAEPVDEVLVKRAGELIELFDDEKLYPPAEPARTSQDVCTVPLLTELDIALAWGKESLNTTSPEACYTLGVLRGEQLVRRKAGLK